MLLKIFIYHICGPLKMGKCWQGKYKSVIVIVIVTVIVKPCHNKLTLFKEP